MAEKDSLENSTPPASLVGRLVMCEYSQDICQDGAAVLCDGKIMAVEQIIFKLRESENIKKLYEYELNERINIFIRSIESMTNGDWEILKELRPDLHKFVKQAVSR